jgi:hypothetical protein
MKPLEAIKRGFAEYDVSRLANRSLRAAINPLTTRLFARRDYDLRNSLVISGGSRSGTTWLAELVATLPRSAVLFEPEHIGNVPEAAQAGLKWSTYVDPDESWPEGRAFFDRVLRGQVLNWHTTSHLPLQCAIRPDVWIVKMVRANQMLGWIVKNFPIRPPALIIRHPCATVASRSQQGWQPLKKAPRNKQFLAAYPEFADVLDGLTELVEFRAALWCLDYFAPLALPRPYPFHVVCYERLVTDGQRELENLFDTWGLKVPQNAKEQLRVFSQTTKKRTAAGTGNDALTKWKKVLSAEQIDKILRVVSAFGLDFYTDAPEPDYDRLLGPCPITAPVAS